MKCSPGGVESKQGRGLTFGVISDYQQTVPTDHLSRRCVHKHQGWNTGDLILVPQFHLHMLGRGMGGRGGG